MSSALRAVLDPWERFLRITPDMRSDRRLRARVFYTCFAIYLALLIVNVVFFAVRVDASALRIPVLLGLATVIIIGMILPRWTVSSSIFGLLCTVIALWPVFSAATTSNAAQTSMALGGGLNTPSLPVLCLGAGMVAVNGARWTILLYLASSILLLLHLGGMTNQALDAPEAAFISELKVFQMSVILLLISAVAYALSQLFSKSSRKVEQMVIRARDAEKELQAKSASLKQAQVELRTVLNTVPARIWYKDDQNKILHLNQAAAESMGMTVDDVQGQNTYDLFGPAAKSYHEDDLKVIRSGQPLRGIIEPYTPEEGIQGWCQTDKIPLNNGQDGPRILVVSTDISTLKNQEAILQSVNKNLNDFASMVSHDLQAPLRKIGLTTELMELELGEGLPETVKPYLADINDGVQRMRDLIRSFLHFMRSSPESIELRSVSLNDVLKHSATSLNEEFKGAEAELTLPSGEYFVRGDAKLLQQVFYNVLENAIKYRAPDRRPDIKIWVEENKQYWTVYVKDNGIGVDPRFASQIFDVFGRAKPDSRIKGSGIGLALCRRIITLHGGTIDLVPQDGDGALFKIELYRAKGS